ncbi:MAG: replication restart helicase PriA [Bacteriovoracaceae bacterium]
MDYDCFDVAVSYPRRPSILSYSTQGFESLKIGTLVEVPLGRRKAKGCIVGFKNLDQVEPKFQDRIKPISGVIDESFSLTEEELELYKWMSQYYHYSLGQLIFDCLPKILKRPRNVVFEKGESSFGEIELSDVQAKPFEVIKTKLDSGFDRFYLHGITGSGKSLIYLKLMKEVLSKGKSVLFLLPEINLTPQFVKVFKTHLDVEILAYHSEVTPSMKNSIWKKLKTEQGPFLILGVRSSVFLPIKNLGLCVVDEEHDSSFKQTDRCPYNGRDVAIKKAAIAKCPVVMGSATPTLENYYNYKKTDNYFPLTERYGKATLPEVILVNDKTKDFDEEIWPFSPETLKALEEALKKSEQALVFVNRLGFANFIQCRGCGHTFKDPNTDTNLRYFRSKNLLSSMHSDYKIPLPESCPECGNLSLLQKGYGTEKIQSVLKNQFPDSEIGRFDRDEIKNFDQLNSVLDRFQERKIDILVGTQMLSKGHNFPGVNTVVILGSDSQLNWPDFRAGEKAYQLLTQVCGRSGRFSERGKVYIQTLNPDSTVFVEVKKHSFNDFYEGEVPLRESFAYPPFSFIASIYVNSRFRERVMQESDHIANIINGAISHHGFDMEVWGPTPLVIEKRANQFTWCLLLKSQSRNHLHNILGIFENNYKAPSGVSFKIDVDPYTIL